MKNKLNLLVNTHTSCKDLWPIFFSRLEKYFYTENVYVFVDRTEYKFPNYVNVLFYNPKDDYPDQYLSCLSRVPDGYVLTVNEDYILNDTVDQERLDTSMDILNNDQKVSFVKLIKGPDSNISYGVDNFYVIPTNSQFVFTQQATIWRKNILEKLHEMGPRGLDAGIGINHTNGGFEGNASKSCRELGVSGIYIYYNESKKGIYHYHSTTFPHIATAIIKGRWNKEYKDEIMVLHNEFSIDAGKRGWS